MTMKIAIGSDHAGFKYKSIIVDMLRSEGHEVMDMGTDSEQAVDYPLFIRPVAEAVARGEYDRGIVLGGSGNGEAIVACNHACDSGRFDGFRLRKWRVRSRRGLRGTTGEHDQHCK